MNVKKISNYHFRYNLYNIHNELGNINNKKSLYCCILWKKEAKQNPLLRKKIVYWLIHYNYIS